MCGEEPERKQSPGRDPEAGRKGRMECRAGRKNGPAGLEGRISDSGLCRAGRRLGRLWHMASDLPKAREHNHSSL